MRPEAAKPMFSATLKPHLELVLSQPDGQPWRLTFSPGIERFIGYYPRLDGIDCGGPLLSFARIDFID